MDFSPGGGLDVVFSTDEVGSGASFHRLDYAFITDEVGGCGDLKCPIQSSRTPPPAPTAGARRSMPSAPAPPSQTITPATPSGKGATGSDPFSSRSPSGRVVRARGGACGAAAGAAGGAADACAGPWAGRKTTEQQPALRPKSRHTSSSGRLGYKQQKQRSTKHVRWSSHSSSNTGDTALTRPPQVASLASAAGQKAWRALPTKLASLANRLTRTAGSKRRALEALRRTAGY